LIREGDFAYIDCVFAVYRVHEGGVISATRNIDSLIMGKKLQEGFKFELKGKFVELLNKNISDFHIGFFYTYLRDKKILKALEHFFLALCINPFRRLKSYKDYYYMYFK